MCPHLDTARLTLRPHTQADFDDLAAMWADPATVLHVIGKPSTPRESWSRLLRYRGLWPVLGYGYWCVRETRTGRYVGDVGLADFHRGARPSIDGTPEAGWVLAAASHGQGYATEAVTAVLQWFDHSPRAGPAICLIAPANTRSVRVARKTGFLPTGAVDLDGDPTPLWTRALPPPKPLADAAATLTSTPS